MEELRRQGLVIELELRALIWGLRAYRELEGSPEGCTGWIRKVMEVSGELEEFREKAKATI